MRFEGDQRNIAPELRGQRVLITGANGFIGANLVRRLLAIGAKPHAFVRPSADLHALAEVVDKIVIHRGSVEDAGSVAEVIRRSAPALIAHLATARGKSTTSEQFVQTSVIGAINLIEAMWQSPGARLIVAGSSLEYAPSNRAIPESWPLGPTTLHGVVKAAAGMLFAHAATTGLPITQLRVFHVYGPWESAHRFLPSAIRLAMQNQPIPLTEQISRRDWIHVDDVVDAILLSAKAESPCDIFNIGSGIEHDNEAVISALENVMGRRLKFIKGSIADRPSDQAHRFANIARAKALLSWEPRHDIASGIRQVLNWHEGKPGIWAMARGDAPVVR